ncbi:hypothetical protein PVAND_010548 [Polypedilum vanderplanki]|uniref:F-box domain-containing protein n=1 Tax=Polypedilum vanderplanki TaxID=319348 RepID=A0A9J6CFY5_POLVA|nr:hypothetical protein PVAND_010548 [Polypedilum vanderplanki]
MLRKSQRIQKKKFDHPDDNSELIQNKKKKKEQNEEQNQNVYNFPIEILIKIIQYIPEHRRNKLLLVSKSFYEAVNIVNAKKKTWIYHCGSETEIDFNEAYPDFLEDSDNKKFLTLRISSINENVVNILKEHGDKVKQLKFNYCREFKFSNYIEILKLVPNCEALCITNLIKDDESENILKVSMLKLKILCFEPNLPIYRDKKLYKCIKCPNLKQLFTCNANDEKSQKVPYKNIAHFENLKLKRKIIKYENDCIVLKDETSKQITSDQIINFERFNTFISSSRQIKNIKFNFEKFIPKYEYEQILKILNKIKNNLNEVTLRGEVKENYLKDILECIKNCKVLNFDYLNALEMSEIKEKVEFKNLEILNVKYGNSLKFIKLSENCLKTFTGYSMENFNEILENQKKLENVEVRTSVIIEKDFLANYKLKRLSLLNSFGVDKSYYIDFIKTQRVWVT